jgi:hypothetical protein
MPLMSLRQYARHRGVSLAAVQKAIATGRIGIAKEERQGKNILKFVNSIDADVAWNNNTDPTQQRTATRKDKGIIDEPSPFSPTPSTPDSEQVTLFPDPPKASQGGGTSKNATGQHGEMYSKARAVREMWEAKTAEVEYKKLLNQLVDVDEIKSQLFRLSSDIKQNILTVSPRVSALIYSLVIAYIEEYKADETAVFNKKEIEDILDGELSTCLENLVNGHFGF